jgi:diaminohydroxyphosphoribosylaminopyrimidine deaminase / 5-amino-6-(5-phosphoribosylamino)uracil reductase
VKPRVTLSYAQTVDGRIATAGGSSQWISAPDSLTYAHRLRADHDAIMVGAGTVCADDPRLTVRLVEGDDPLRVVVDSGLRIPPTAAVLADGAAGRTILAVTDRASVERRDAVQRMGATVWCLPANAAGQVDLAALLIELGAAGVRSIMVEGGAALLTNLLREQLVDRICICIAPKILGSGTDAIGDLGIADLDRSLQLTNLSVVARGPDLVLDAQVRYPGGMS